MSRFLIDTLRQRRSTLRAVGLLCPALLLGCAHGVQAQGQNNSHKAAGGVDRDAFRNTIPAPDAAPTLQLPIPQELTLQNGLGVWIFPKRDLPLVQVVALIKSGSAQDPKGQEGLASLTAEVMRRGTRSRSAQAIALEVENLGGRLDAYVEDDATVLQVGAMTQNIGPVLDVLADVLQHAAFDRSEFERAQKQRLSELVQLQNEPRASAQTVMRRVVFGQHPYGSNGQGTCQSVRAVHPDAMAAFYKRHVRPTNAQIIIVGDVSPDEARAMIEQRLGHWRGPAGEQHEPPVARAKSRQVALVHRPEASQSQLVVCGMGLSRHDPDYYSAVLANAILGGMFNSRLNMNLREDKGWTYGVRSSFSFLRAPGPFAIGTSIRTDVTLDGIQEIFQEIERMRREEVSDEELQGAKNRFALGLPGSFEGLSGIAQMLSTLALHKLPLTYYRDLPEALAKVTPKDIQRVINKHLAPEALSIVVVGDQTVLEPGLVALGRGPVHHFDGEGRPLGDAPASIPAKSSL